ncbi:MAG: deoxyribodipyrimidine photo-lyase [Chitinophagales bacterium]
MNNTPVAILWLRRDLRLTDHAAMYHALRSGHKVLPLFIFDTNILSKLPRSDKRVAFIHRELKQLAAELETLKSTLLVEVGSPVQIWEKMLTQFQVKEVFCNEDYEPYAIKRDAAVQQLLESHGIGFRRFKDHVIFSKEEVLKEDGKPYTVYTPYSKKWLHQLLPFHYKSYPVQKYTSQWCVAEPAPFPSMETLGFENSNFEFPEKKVSATIVSNYHQTRDIPSIHGTSHLGLHLRFGTLSVRKLLEFALPKNDTFVRELIWRDFYQQILAHFPYVATGAFRKEFNHIEWRNNEEEFQAWCNGCTGYPLVDAGMRELNATGYMHNRVRMVTASFLTKHLLIDWRWGEAYFAEKLLDFDLAANNGGWQWAAGTGTDAAPYFRVFNPQLQQEKFDKDFTYIRQWVPEYGSAAYVQPIVDHAFARQRCLAAYAKAKQYEAK